MLSRDSSPIIAPCLANQRDSSLKQHIGVLGALALATLAIATSLGWPILRQTESAQVAEAERLLDRATAQLAVRYDYLRSPFEATSETSTPTRE